MLKKAFTLIELLVVIAIIAILAAILFPVFAKAKDAAKKTQSISNQKQIGTSMMIYLSDHDDVMPMAGYLKPPAGADPRPVMFSIYDALQPYMKNVQIFESPGDAPVQSWADRLATFNLRPEIVEKASYIPNLGLFGENLCGFKTAYTPVMSHTAVQEQTETIMLFDGYIKQAAPDLNFYTFLGAVRHGEGVVLNFTDSHAKYVQWNAVPALADDFATPAGSRAPTYYGWRVDTTNCGPDGLCSTKAELEAVPSTITGYSTNGTTGPYTDLHGVPGSGITDSEDTIACP